MNRIILNIHHISNLTPDTNQTKMFHYTYPITRYGDVETTIESDTRLTNKKQVMSFYKRAVTPQDRENILAAYHTPGFFDGFDYIKDNLVDRTSDRGPCEYWELMGDCQFYEGLTLIGDNHYNVDLGS